MNSDLFTDEINVTYDVDVDMGHAHARLHTLTSACDGFFWTSSGATPSESEQRP